MLATTSIAQARELRSRPASAGALRFERAKFERAGALRFARADALRFERDRLARAAFSRWSGWGSALVSSAPVGKGPAALAVDPATHTVYVENGSNINGPNAGGDTVSVIDTRQCDAQNVSRCRGRWPTITVGNLPSGIAIDERTDTVYVTNFADSTVSVFNGATCNGEDSFGCDQTPATVPLAAGSGPVGIFADQANSTVYIPNIFDGDVSLLNSATCNATHLAACPTTPPPVIDVGAFPDDLDATQASHTVYVAVQGAVAVFDANTCNATDQSGCGTIGDLPGDPAGVGAAEVDTANDTLYTANLDNTVSAFDLQDCDAADLSGCASDQPGTVSLPLPGDSSVWLAVDSSLHTVYIDFHHNDELTVINTDQCNGADPAGCANLTPPELHTGTDPEMVGLDADTQTLYTANAVSDDVSVIAAARCDAEQVTGCRRRVPEIPVGGFAGIAVDPSVNTVYTASGPNTLAMINAADCNASHAGGCSQTPRTVAVGDQVNTRPFGEAVDPATHTVYVGNESAGSSGSVSVFDDRTCNATVQTGCGNVATIQIPEGAPSDVEVNPLTDTVYVAAIAASGPNLILVFNGDTCNASHRLGCGQTPALIKFGDSGDAGSSVFMAVDAATNTIYATDFIYSVSPNGGDSVYVIDGATCDATNKTGCNHTPATVTLNPAPSNPFGIPGQEPNPVGIAVDEPTDTIYTANLADGEGPGTVSVINGTICNGQNARGCDQTPATAPAGFGTLFVALDQLTNQVYTANGQDTSVTRIDGNSCNGTNSEGCSRTRTRAIVGDEPGAIAIDPLLNTAYVGDNEGLSVVPLTR